MLRVSRVAARRAHVPQLAVHRSRDLLRGALRGPNGVLHDALRNVRNVARVAPAGRRDGHRSAGHVRAHNQMGDDRRGVLCGGGRRPPRNRRVRLDRRMLDAQAGCVRLRRLCRCPPRHLRSRDRHLVRHRKPAHQLH